MPRRILVTGASGLVGSHILFLCSPDEAIGTYREHRPHDTVYPYKPVDFHNIDQIEPFLREIHPDICIHAAAMSQLDWCEDHPESAVRVNAEAPLVMATVARDLGCRFVLISTDMVFDGLKGWYREDDAASPINRYGQTKLTAERSVLQAYPGALVVRIALVYGMPVAPGRGQSFLNWLLNHLQAGRSVKLFSDQYRTPVEVRECAEAILALALSDAEGVVHVAGAERLDRFTFGEYVADAFHLDRQLLKRVSMQDVAMKAPRPADVSMKTDRLERILGRRLSTCREGLQRIAKAQ